MVDIKKLLEEAKRRYPVGTVFKSAHQEDICEVVFLEHYWIEGVGLDVNIIQNRGAGWLYKNGKWAEIVSLPYEKQIELW